MHTLNETFFLNFLIFLLVPFLWDSKRSIEQNPWKIIRRPTNLISNNGRQVECNQSSLHEEIRIHCTEFMLKNSINYMEKRDLENSFVFRTFPLARKQATRRRRYRVYVEDTIRIPSTKANFTCNAYTRIMYSRDVQQRLAQSSAHLVNVVPLLSGDRSAHVVFQLELVVQPLEHEQRDCVRTSN